ncbi:hypothetical protein BBJ28_00017122 [Nothophytophthora sp. Chile5]|nr:hypothetical protein BBJ28_00017122 [Nothophytophthora sp. Chile5]
MEGQTVKTPANDQHYDVVYHRYPSAGFDPAEKPTPIPMAITVDVDAPLTPRYDSQSPATSPSCRALSFFARLGRLFAFHTLNAVLGIGGAILVIVLAPLSVGLIPLCGVGLALFQITAAITEQLAWLDIRLANMVTRSEPKLRKALGIQSGFSTNNGCTADSCGSRLFFLSPRTLGVMLYFATLKLVVGIMSCAAVSWGLVLPVEALASGGQADIIGWLKYKDGHATYVGAAVGFWVVGVLCIALVPKLSVPLTAWACSESEDKQEGDEKYQGEEARNEHDFPADLEATAMAVETPAAKTL